MKRKNTLFLLCLLLAPLTTAALPSADSLMTVYEQAKGSRRLAVGNELFRLLAEEEVTDSLLQFGNNTPADTLSLQLYYWMGERHLFRQEFQRGADYLEQACRLVNRKDLRMTSDCYNELAICQARLGEFAEAIEASGHSVAADEQSGDRERLMVSLNTLGGIHTMAKQYAEAEELVTRSLQLATELGDSVKMAVRHGTLAEIQQNLGKMDDALYNARQALRLDSLRGDRARMAVRQTQVASVYYAMDRLDEARTLLTEARPVLEQTGNRMSLAICLNILGHAYLKDRQWDEAADCLQQALDFYRLTGERYSQLKAHWGLWKALSRGQTSPAEEHLQTYALMKDSLYEEEVARMMADYDARYENEQLARQNAEHRRQHRALLWGGSLAVAALLVIVALLVWLLRMKSRAARMQTQLFEERISQSERQAGIPEPAEAPSAAPTDGTSAADRLFIQRLTATVRQGLTRRDFNAQELAKIMCMSYSQLNRRLQEVMDLSPAVFIMQLRLEKAKKMLAQTDTPIGDIAISLGFEDHSYFTRAFKQAYGETPKNYRQAKRGKL